MRKEREQSGFTLLEVLVALATVLILISAMMGVGRYIKTRANIDLTEGLLGTLSTALTQYYDDTGGFPFDTPDTNTDGILGNDYFSADLENDISIYNSGLLVSLNVADLLEQDGNGNPVSGASSAGLFYFLDRNPASRAIASAVSNSLVTNKQAGTDVKVNVGGVDYDLPRYIDPWGTSIRYEYLAGTAFPTLTSAGPDKVFDTPDDIIK